MSDPFEFLPIHGHQSQDEMGIPCKPGLMCLFCLCVLVLITWRTLYYFSCLHEDLHEHPISSQNAVKMTCWPELIYYFRYALPECHFTTSRQLLVLLVCICVEHMKNIRISLTSWRRKWPSKPEHDGGDKPDAFPWHEPISPHEDSSQHPTAMNLTS